MTSKLCVAGSLALAAALVAGCSGSSVTGDGEFPSKDITIIVPYAAGGPTDLAARAPSTCLEKQLEQSVVVENKPGGGGAVGAAELANATPDGHTLGVLSTATVAIAPFQSKGAGFSPDDFSHIGEIYEFPSVIQVKDDSPYQTAEELFAAAEKGKKVVFGTPGASTPYHIELQRLAEEYGVKVKLVPFDGAAPARAALLGDNVDAVFDVFSSSDVQQFEKGKIRPLATGLPERTDLLPDIPTLKEIGYPKLVNARGLFSLSAPAGIPEDARDKLGDALSACLQKPKVVKALGEAYVKEDFVDGDQISTVYADVVDVYRPILTS